MATRDPLFAVRRTARNLQYAADTAVFGELNAKTPVSTKPIHVVFVHGGLSCCFDAFVDLFPRIRTSLLDTGDAVQQVSLLRFEHDTYQPIRANAERLCALVMQKLAPKRGGEDPDLLFIAHSRGGLVARLASDLLIDRANWSKDRLEVFTYGSPHRGTPFFESEVTFMVDRLIRWAGIASFGLARFFHDLRYRGIVRTLRRNYCAWLRPGLLMGLGSGSSTLALRRMIFGRFGSASASVRGQGPSILSWPPGIEDVRETSDFFSQIAPQPSCARFWTFGSTYDLRRNPQKLDVASRYVLRMVQKAFVLLSEPDPLQRARARPAGRAAARTESNDLVVTIDSATAIGRAFRIEENLWHCGYFKGSPGEKLARYLEQTMLFAQGGRALSGRPVFDELA